MNMNIVNIRIRRATKEECQYLGSGLCQHFILLQHTLPIRFVGDLEEGDAFDGGHPVGGAE